MIPKLIGLSGYKGSGKDEVAKYLVERFGFQRFAFADPLKEAVAAVYGFSQDQLHGSLKDEVDPFWGVKPRDVLVDIGDRGFRGSITGQDTHVRGTERRILNYWSELPDGADQQQRVVISDCRYLNECEMIRRLGGQVWLVDRSALAKPLNAAQLHPSERLPHDPRARFDHVVDNNWSLGKTRQRLFQDLARMS